MCHVLPIEHLIHDRIQEFKLLNQRRVHAACGWFGFKADVEELRQLHVHYDDQIINLEYADRVWKKVS